MKFSKFGQKFTQPTGISQLMDDLGDGWVPIAAAGWRVGLGNAQRNDAAQRTRDRLQNAAHRTA